MVTNHQQHDLPTRFNVVVDAILPQLSLLVATFIFLGLYYFPDDVVIFTTIILTCAAFAGFYNSMNEVSLKFKVDSLFMTKWSLIIPFVVNMVIWIFPALIAGIAAINPDTNFAPMVNILMALVVAIGFCLLAIVKWVFRQK